MILYHALGSEVRSTDLSDGLVATTMNGEDITINLDPPTINVDTKILVDDGLVDIEASNGGLLLFSILISSKIYV